MDRRELILRILKNMNKRKVKKGGISGSDAVNLVGQNAIDSIENDIPVVAQINSVVRPIVDKLVALIPSQELESAKRDGVDKFYNLFKDDQLLYNADGSLMFPRNQQIMYLLLARYSAEHGIDGYKDYMMKIQKELGVKDSELGNVVYWIPKAHNH